MLRTDYADDIPASGVTKRSYTMTDNGDGSVSFNDVTDYQSRGDTFGAADINATNVAVNKCVEYATGTLAAETTSVTINAPSGQNEFFFDGGHIEVYVPQNKVQDLVVASTSITLASGSTPSSCTVTFSSSVLDDSIIHVYCK